jgi:NADH-quinone oxidoreductase subunit M
MLTPVSLWSESVGFPMLTTLTLIPLVAMIAVLAMRSSATIMRSAYIATLVNVLLSLYLLIEFDDNKTGIQFTEQFSLFGLNYSVGVDGLNILFIPLIACSTLLVLIYISATRTAGNSRLIACVLGYEAILIGAFCALNVLQFWLLTAFELIPILLVTRQSGLDQKKRFLVIRLLQYFGASLLLTLCGFLLLAFGLIDSEHELTFDLLTLQNNNAYLHDETLIFILLFYGFAIRMPLFPFHGWLPLLAEQSSLTSMAVFVIGAKLGVYAMIRFIFPLVPGVAEQWANYVLILCLISIFYGALLAFMQNNAYRLLAFATISHTGMLVFGVFSFNEHGLEGTLLLSLVYGLASVGMLFSIGLINEQTRTAMIPRLGDLFDSHTTLALLFMITALSTMIMPGSLGFDAGHLLLEGVIEEHEWGVSVTILTGHVLAAGFLLWAFQRMFLATSKRHFHYASNDKTIVQERIIAFVICALHIGTGLNSMPLLNLIDKDVEELVSQYPVHSSQQDEVITPVENDATDDKDATE